MANRYGVKRGWKNKNGKTISYLKTYEDACMAMGLVYNDAAKTFFEKMESYGHTEKSICYAAYRVSDDVVKLIHKIVGVECLIDVNGSYGIYGVEEYEDEFFEPIRDILKKYSWEKDNPKWTTYLENKKAAEEMVKKIDEAEKENNKIRIDFERGKYPYAKLGIDASNGNAIITQYYVYFIQGECGGAIKIGFSQNPKSRLKSIQTGMPDLLKLLAVIPGDEKLEKELHNEFNDLRLRGEWFRPDDRLLSRINKLKVMNGTKWGDI